MSETYLKLYFCEHSLNVVDDIIESIGHVFGAHLASYLMVFRVLLSVVEQRLP